MLTLAELAALHAAHSDAAALPVQPVEVGDVVIGDEAPVLMGTVNLSPDSTYRSSVALSTETAVRQARTQVAQGAAVIDFGAESSNAYTERVDAAGQIARLEPVVRELADEMVVSVETYDPVVVKACLAAGARFVNLTGSEHEDAILRSAADHGAAVVLCYSPSANVRENFTVVPTDQVFTEMLDHFGPRVEAARALGVQVVVDPGIGFTFANLTDLMDRLRYQSVVLASSFRLRALGAPICNALPTALPLFDEQFRTAEGFFAVIAALGGTHMFRTHEVPHLRAVLSAMQELTVDPDHS